MNLVDPFDGKKIAEAVLLFVSTITFSQNPSCQQGDERGGGDRKAHIHTLAIIMTFRLKVPTSWGLIKNHYNFVLNI